MSERSLYSVVRWQLFKGSLFKPISCFSFPLFIVDIDDDDYEDVDGDCDDVATPTLP